MLFGIVALVIGFILLPLVIMLLIVFYFARIAAMLWEIGHNVLIWSLSDNKNVAPGTQPLPMMELNIPTTLEGSGHTDQPKLNAPEVMQVEEVPIANEEVNEKVVIALDKRLKRREGGSEHQETKVEHLKVPPSKRRCRLL
ncbi:early-responsive to dehydration stress protein(ERD4) [Striga asiatica]|uniref:Early-responsive to dehydration stress protein(ERD4) n=1 Tax=Striga asiatica TaxID=4170 RepID=A0A5A7QUB0_STRAF|nr:early-responsive to dehydration stress protein(ERD4) [Striga asiatica]